MDTKRSSKVSVVDVIWAATCVLLVAISAPTIWFIWLLTPVMKDGNFWRVWDDFNYWQENFYDKLPHAIAIGLMSAAAVIAGFVDELKKRRCGNRSIDEIKACKKCGRTIAVTTPVCPRCMGRCTTTTDNEFAE